MSTLQQFVSFIGVNGAIGIVLAGAVAVLARLFWRPRLGRSAREIEIQFRQGLSSHDAIQQLAAIIETQERQGRAWSFAQNLVWFMLGSCVSFFTPELRHVIGLP